MAKYQRNRFVDVDYLKYVSKMQCCLEKYSNNCDGYIEVHHLLKPWIGSRGMSLKSDDRNVLPLCMKHHRELHTKHGTEKNLANHYELSDDFLKSLSENLYVTYTSIPKLDDLPF